MVDELDDRATGHYGPGRSSPGPFRFSVRDIDCRMDISESESVSVKFFLQATTGREVVYRFPMDNRSSHTNNRFPLDKQFN